VSVTSEVKKLIEASEVPRLDERIDTLQRSLQYLENFVFKMAKDVSDHIKLVDKLSKEISSKRKLDDMRKMATKEYLRIRKDGCVGYYRDFTSVKNRWDRWKEAYQDGVPLGEIASQWGVSKATIKYAKDKKFIAEPHPRHTTKRIKL
jgi:hypothetical protein